MNRKIQRCLASAIVAFAPVGAVAQQAPAQQPSATPRAAPRPQQAQPAPPAPAQPPAPGQTAQPSVAVPSPQSNSPQRTTATYDDWVVQCETVAGPPQRKLCDMTQVTQMTVQGRNQPFSRLSIIQPSKDLVTNLIVQLPVNVTFATNVRVQASDNDNAIAGPFTRCVPSGCFAELELKDEALKKFRAASGAGKVSFADSTGQGVSVPVSFNGFSKAYDALLRE